MNVLFRIKVLGPIPREYETTDINEASSFYLSLKTNKGCTFSMEPYKYDPIPRVICVSPVPFQCSLRKLADLIDEILPNTSETLIKKP